MKSIFIRSQPVVFAALAAAALTLSERPVRACGGCFHQPEQVTVVTGHRMALSVSTSQTVLWDQIQYSGSPLDFSWVLPVQPDTVIQASHDAWFEALDAMTTPVINGPANNCNTGGGFSCVGSSASSASGFADESAGGSSVQVLSESVVGPYDSATLKATDPNALENWLTANGYVLPDALRPTVAAYVAGGFDFIALRLRPGQGVQAMLPVRVVTHGADVLLPLRMVAAGVGAQVGVTLYVISEGRYEAATPFFNATVDDSKLTWNATQSLSNYQELATQLMQGQNGHTWLTEFSGLVSLMPTQPVGEGQCGAGASSYYGGYGQSFADLYLSQCPCVDAGACASPPGSLSGAEASADGAAAVASDATQDTGQMDGQPSVDAADATLAPDTSVADDAAGFSGDAAGFSPDAASCLTVACQGFDDLDVAMVGLDASNTWVTRLRAILPVNVLTESDLQIQASASQTPVSNVHNASGYSPSFNPCPNSGGCSASAEEPRRYGQWLVVGALVFVAVALIRRRRQG